MRIRKATKKDIIQLSVLLNEYDLYENKLDKTFEVTSIKDTIKLIGNQFRDKDVLYLCAEINGIIGGLVNYSVEKIGHKKRGILHNLIISEKFRKQGFGKALIKECLNELKKAGCKSVRSRVMEKNKNAQIYWKKQGWDVQKIKGYSITQRIR